MAEMIIEVNEEIVRRILGAHNVVLTGQRVEHHITLIPAGDGFTARLNSYAKDASVVKEIAPEIHLSANFKLKGNNNVRI